MQDKLTAAPPSLEPCGCGGVSALQDNGQRDDKLWRVKCCGCHVMTLWSNDPEQIAIRWNLAMRRAPSAERRAGLLEAATLLRSLEDKLSNTPEWWQVYHNAQNAARAALRGEHD